MFEFLNIDSIVCIEIIVQKKSANRKNGHNVLVEVTLNKSFKSQVLLWFSVYDCFHCCCDYFLSFSLFLLTSSSVCMLFSNLLLLLFLILVLFLSLLCYVVVVDAADIGDIVDAF